MVGFDGFLQGPLRPARKRRVRRFWSRPVSRGDRVNEGGGEEAARETRRRKSTRRDVVGSVRGLQSHPAVRGKRLGVVGLSLGAFWSLWLAQERPGNLCAIV